MHPSIDWDFFFNVASSLAVTGDFLQAEQSWVEGFTIDPTNLCDKFDRNVSYDSLCKIPLMSSVFMEISESSIWLLRRPSWILKTI